MFDFLRRHKPLPGLDFLGTDMHAHWLPGLDDGAKSMEDSLGLITDLVDLGYRQLIATPHVMADLYPNSSSAILERLGEVKQAVAERGIDVKLGAAAEYLLDEGFVKLLERGDLLTLPGNYLLVEMSFVSAPPDVQQLFFKMQVKGYKPILAHPERYRYLHNSFESYRSFYERGAILQVNLLSLVGHYGKDIKQVAWKLIDENIVGMLGTDAHHRIHTKELRDLLNDSEVTKLPDRQQWLNTQLAN